MRDSTTQFRSTVESPNDINNLVNSLFEQLESRLKRKSDCDIKEKNERKTKRERQHTTIKVLVESICKESGMSQEDISEYVSKAFKSGSDAITLEINYGSFGRVGIDVSEGQTDVFSSTYDNYMFHLPENRSDDSISELQNEIESRSVTHDDGVGFALYFKSGKDRITVRAHVFDRPNELLLQRDMSSSWIRSILGS